MKTKIANTPFTFNCGSIKVESHNVNALREFVEDIYTSVGIGNELPQYITDMFFSIELSYQKYHSLPDDDYTFHPELK